MRTLELNQEEIIEVFASEPFNGNHNLFVNQGEIYSFSVDPNQCWKDSFICTNENGFWNPLLLFGGARVSKSNCFCICGTIAKNEENHFVIGNKLDNYKIQKSGLLYFFANDSKKLKFYKNNSGSIFIKIRRIA